MAEEYDPESPALDLRRRKLKSAAVFTIVAIMCGGLIAFLFGLQPPVQGTERYSAVGDFPPGHAWFNTSRPISLYEDLQGHVVVLLFCDFSRLSDLQGLAGFEAVGERFLDQPVELIIVFIPSDSLVGNWRSSIENWGIVSPVIVDHSGLVSQSLMADRHPMVEIIDSHGRVAGSYYETWSATDLDGVISDVLMLGQAARSLASEPFVPERGEFIPPELAGE